MFFGITVWPPGNMKNEKKKKKITGTVPGNFENVPGITAKKSWDPKFIYLLQTAEMNHSQELFMEPIFPWHKTQVSAIFSLNFFFTWRKTQVSAVFPRTFPGIETAGSWDLHPAGHGSGWGLETARGVLVQPRSFIGRLGVFVMSLWQYWFIQFHLLDSKLQPFHHHYAVAKQHCDHANPKIAFHFAYAATWNLSQHGHRNHGKEDTIINTARMRSWDCHKNKASGKFQQFTWFYPEIHPEKTVFCPFSVCKGVSLHLRQCMPKWHTFAWHQMFPVITALHMVAVGATFESRSHHNYYHWTFLITNLIPQEFISVIDVFALRHKLPWKFVM